MLQQIAIALEEPDLELFAVELSLDGTAGFHDRFRGTPGAFERAIKTYDALAGLQTRDPRLRIHASSTATNVNIVEIKRLTAFLFDRCPQMDHHNLAIIRGDRKNPSLLTPEFEEYRGLYEYIRRLWAPRESGRYGAIVEPMTQWAKLQALACQRQVIPCQAGRLCGVVYANGDISACELHSPLGNVREKPFGEIWASEEATRLRASIARRECHCTTEVFLWPSIVFRPASLARAMVGARVWRKIEPLPPKEKLGPAGSYPASQPTTPAAPSADER
jgi:MoaA/NifB/PqqE/SkfB family radical SAM enzyme